MKVLLWLDDLRNPFLDIENKVPKGDWIIHWVRDAEEFALWINSYQLPFAVSFDHDLKPEHYTPEYFWDDYEESKKYQDFVRPNYKYNTGVECANLLRIVSNARGVDLPKCYVHSANPVGADYIKEVLNIN